MREFDIFIPLANSNGNGVGKTKINNLKKRLLSQFGGVTYFPQNNEGLWKVGKVTLRDKIVVFRVIAMADPKTQKFFAELKTQIEREWKQEEVLIISRSVKIV